MNMYVMFLLRQHRKYSHYKHIYGRGRHCKQRLLQIVVFVAGWSKTNNLISSAECDPSLPSRTCPTTRTRTRTKRIRGSTGNTDLCHLWRHTDVTRLSANRLRQWFEWPARLARETEYRRQDPEECLIQRPRVAERTVATMRPTRRFLHGETDGTAYRWGSGHSSTSTGPTIVMLYAILYSSVAD